VSGEALRRELIGRARQASRDTDSALAALLRAGELEAALEDDEHGEATQARRLTDGLAGIWLATEANRDLRPHLAWLEQARLPSSLSLRRPEGYAYYALDLRAYARGAGQPGIAEKGLTAVGVRSIGTSLSAVVLAAAKARGARAQRFTVRPSGHPWQRRLAFTADQRALVEANRQGAFMVVDEGPGLSGSTFLAVGEALLALGIAAEQITFLCSHPADPGRLLASDAVSRWPRFRTWWPHGQAPARDMSAGRWRRVAFAGESQWPACWAQRERRKHLSPDGKQLMKFIGLPPYGESPLHRAEQLADAGYSPSVSSYASGYLAQPWQRGRPATRQDARFALSRMADYLAFRARACRSEPDGSDDLEAMMRTNVAEFLGQDLARGLQLRCEQPVHADARMAPHEWVIDEQGGLLKTDAVEHGDDHLFPGFCDIAWDIAGAIVEWDLSPGHARALLALYQQRTHDAVQARLRPYLVAYASLQLGCMKLALSTCEQSEQRRITEAAFFYRAALCRSVGIEARGWPLP